MERLVDLGRLGKMTVEELGDKGPLSLTRGCDPRQLRPLQ